MMHRYLLVDGARYHNALARLYARNEVLVGRAALPRLPLAQRSRSGPAAGKHRSSFCTFL